MSFEDERSPTLSEVLRSAMAANQRNLYTMLPGKIVFFDGAKRSATVQPLIRNTFKTFLGTEVKEDLPQIQNVPVIFPEGQTSDGTRFSITFPMEAGSYVELRFAQRRLDEYLASDGRMSDPGSFVMHDINDCVATPGMGPYSERPSQDVSIDTMILGVDNGTQVRVKPDLIELGSENATYKAAVNEKVQAEFDKIYTQLTAINAWQTAVLITVAAATTASAAAALTPAGVAAPVSPFSAAYTTALTSGIAANTPTTPPTKSDTHSDVVTLD